MNNTYNLNILIDLLHQNITDFSSNVIDCELKVKININSDCQTILYIQFDNFIKKSEVNDKLTDLLKDIPYKLREINHNDTSFYFFIECK